MQTTVWTLAWTKIKTTSLCLQSSLPLTNYRRLIITVICKRCATWQWWWDAILPDLSVGGGGLSDDRAGLRWRQGLLDHYTAVVIGHPRVRLLVLVRASLPMKSDILFRKREELWVSTVYRYMERIFFWEVILAWHNFQRGTILSAWLWKVTTIRQSLLGQHNMIPQLQYSHRTKMTWVCSANHQN